MSTSSSSSSSSSSICAPPPAGVSVLTAAASFALLVAGVLDGALGALLTGGVASLLAGVLLELVTLDVPRPAGVVASSAASVLPAAQPPSRPSASNGWTKLGQLQSLRNERGRL